jgi:hypothetical protein
MRLSTICRIKYAAVILFAAALPQVAVFAQQITADLESADHWKLSAPKGSSLTGDELPATGRVLKAEIKGYYQKASLKFSEQIPAKPKEFYLFRCRIKVVSDSQVELTTKFESRDSKYPEDPSRATVYNNGTIFPGSWQEIESIMQMHETGDRLSFGFELEGGSATVLFSDMSLVKTNTSYYCYVPPVAESYPDSNQLASALGYLQTAMPASGMVNVVSGRPRLVVNGKSLPPVYVASFVDHSIPEASSKYQVGDFKKAGVKVRDVHLNLTKLWKGKNTYDFSSVENSIMRILGLDPESFIIIRVMVFPYPEWSAEHPDQLVSTEDGKFFIADKSYHCVGVGREPNAQLGEVYMPSYLSGVLREETGDALKALIRHIHTNVWGRAVIGYHLIGGSDATFRPPSEATQLGDYSPAALSSFRAWLKTTYTNDSQLQTAWHNSSVTRDSANIPSEVHRKNTPFFLDRGQFQDVMDYEEFYTEAIDDLVLSYAQIVKKETAGRSLAGIYYAHNDHLAQGSKILASTNVDFLVCFENGVGARLPGRAPSAACVADSAYLNNRLFIQELDIRTSRAVPIPRHIPLCGRPQDGQEYNALMIRDFGRMLVRGHGGYWFDMSGGWFNDPVIMGGISKVNRAFTDDLGVTNKPYAELAVFIDEKSMQLVSPQKKRQLFVNLMQYQNALDVSGVPYHLFLQQDITNAALSKYKAYLFLNAYSLTESELKTIATLKNNPECTVAFLHAPGQDGAANDKLAAEAIHNLTGIKVAPAGERRLIAEPAEPGMKNIFGACKMFSKSTFPAPSFKVSDASTNVTVVANYAGSDLPAAAVKIQPGKAKLFFSGAIDLTPEFINLFARWAGCWVAATSGDAVYVNRDWLIIHAAYEGQKEIYLIEHSRVTDYASSQVLYNNTDKVVLDMKKGETRWFRLHPVGP